MNFFKNNHEDTRPNSYDIELRSLYAKFITSHCKLVEAAKNVIIKSNVIDLYPVSPQYRKALEFSAKAKNDLVACFDAFETARKNYNDYLQKNINNLNRTCNYSTKTVTAFKVVENVYRSFYTEKFVQ